jgi:hypothetical protein
MKTCETCKFFEFDNDLGGRCHRYPPTPLYAVYQNWDHNSSQYEGVSGDVVYRMPEVSKSDWCGEHKVKP